ncbi:F420-dependent glucose-6-phosphate dehydrogenase [Halarchaeum acidiphilum MH1-52-1]|uniref:F420-dependent glucose-6-phosphate dehydrogenase n=1 Tax=Halarchaeum acidiphilum MH1-52-1 TaxID=1261545 RepID=U3AAM0_9EURY|nr:TIGR03557 family F420-dependent LLM class oxidoreductase [Halarchaeum acidiphilum]GAD51803.1 F420-dependent glucose-6-phosphate dehydrogenase [Halarchaeum acidiphilum MH1-52-1]
MTAFGYALSSEEHDGSELASLAAEAEARGFDFAPISDHYHPWIRQQGEAPYVWSTLGAVSETTDDIEVGTGVTAPIIREHPANLAQATATTASMLDGRFFFGVGTGERLNEHVTGAKWPPHHVRLEMLEEAIDVVRALWSGEMVSHDGEHYTVENAQLFTLPEETPPIYVSAYGEHSARTAAAVGDGIVCVGPNEGVVETYRDAGGDGPTYGQLAVCYAETEEEAVETVSDWWPTGELAGPLSSELPTPAHFEHACEDVTREDVREGHTLTDPDPDAHIAALQEFVDAGYDHVYVHNVGPNQEAFFDFYEEDVLSAF